MVRAVTLAGCLILCACSTSTPPASVLVVGVSQRGAEPLARPSGQPLLSEAYVVHRDGRVTLTENYADAPSQRRLLATGAQADKLFDLLRSEAWRALSERPDGMPGSEEVEVTIETEGKVVTRWARVEEPIFREVLATLAAIRRSRHGG